MKLTEDNIENWKTSPLNESVDLWNQESNNLIIRGLTLEEAEELKQQILENQEKAEKWKNLQNIFYDRNIRLTDRWLHDTVENWARIEQKIIQLTEKLEQIKELSKVFQREEWGDCRYIRKMICGKLNAILASQEKE